MSEAAAAALADDGVRDASAAAATGGAEVGVTFLPNGRPRATRRDRKKKPQPTAEQTDSAAAVDSVASKETRVRSQAAVVGPARDAWLAWYQSEHPSWVAKSRTEVGNGMAMLPNAPSVMAMTNYPKLTNVDQVATPDLAHAFYKRIEFAVCPFFAPQLIERFAPLGIFPMSIPGPMGLRYPAFKLHVSRCVTVVTTRRDQLSDFGNSFDERDVYPPRFVGGVSKFASQFAVVTDAHWTEVVAMIRRQHGEDWLCQPLERAFRYMFLNPDEQAKVKLHCIALLDINAVKAGLPPAQCVVAGELGFVVGSTYSSLTGAYIVDGTGTLQLAVLKALLVMSGFKTWDLGMTMVYKVKALGGFELPRKRWMALSIKGATERATPMSGLALPQEQQRPSVLFGAVLHPFTPCDVVFAAAAASACLVPAV